MPSQNNYRKALQEAQADIDRIIARLQQLDSTILDISRNVRTAAAGFSSGGGGGMQAFNNAMKEQTFIMKSSNAILHEHFNLINKLNRKKEEAANLTTAQKVELQLLNRQEKLQALATSEAAGAYGRLVAQLKQAKIAYQNAIANSKTTRKELDKLGKEFRDLQRRVNAANDATRNFSKKGLMGAVRGIRSLASAFGIAGAAFIVADVVKKVFNLTKRLQSLDFALKTVTSTSREYARSMTFISDISNRFGGNIITVTERYTKFLAAAKQSGVGLKDTEKVFSSITKASGVLGLKTDELTGVYLALEQMLSKGKVTTEELRRQLGERLPGAFGIMAQAMEVTIPQLDQMLKKGEVLSGEALPKFAAELTRVYGLDRITQVDTVVAAQTRFNNAITELVWIFTQGELSDTMIWVFDTLAEGIQRAGAVTKEIKSSFDALKASFVVITEAVKGLINQLDPTGATWNAIAKFLKEFWAIFTHPGGFFVADTIKFISLSIAGLAGALGVIVEIFKETSLLRPWEFIMKMGGAVARVNEGFKAGIKSMAEYQAELANKQAEEDYNRLLNETATTMVMLAKMKKEDLTIEQARAQLEGLTLEQMEAKNEEVRKAMQNFSTEIKNDKDKIEALKGSIAWHKQEISTLKKKRDSLATTTQEYLEMTKAIDSLETSLNSLLASFEISEMEGGKIKIDLPSELEVEEARKAIFEAWEKGGKGMPKETQIEKQLRESAKKDLDGLSEYQDKKRQEQLEKERYAAEQRIAIFKTVTDAFADFYDVDMSKFEFLLDDKKNSTEQWADAAREAVAGVLNASLRSYDIELQEAQRARDLILNNSLATEKEKRLAREKFEREERAIKTRKAKAERTATLIQIAVDTAAAIVKATAQTGVLAPAFIPIMIAIGATQAAIVASQPIPKFEKGHLSGTHEGAAWINDARSNKYQEIVERASGQIEIYKNRNQLIEMKKGDKVHKSKESFLDYHNIENAVWEMNLASNGKELSRANVDGAIISELIRLNQTSKNAWDEFKNIAKRPIVVPAPKVIIENEDSGYV